MSEQPNNSTETLVADPRDLVGKTIAQVGYTNALLLRFTDGTYAAVRADSEECIFLDHGFYGDDERVLVGAVSQEEFRRRKTDREHRDAEAAERMERKEYERLKAKFEGKANEQPAAGG